MEQHFSCLDLFWISWTPALGGRQCTYGALLEIWPSGGVIQTDRSIGIGEAFLISVPGAQLEARVAGSDQDEYGCYLRFEVTDPWFPVNYQPPYLAGVCSQIATSLGAPVLRSAASGY